MNKHEYEPYFDNLKALLIFLVVLGHFLEIRINNDLLTRLGFSFIYAFHMPLFVFISGYFSKQNENSLKLFKNLLLPYLIFNSLWYFLAMIYIPNTVFRWFYPGMAFWYLLSLFIWRLLLPVLINIRYIIPISVFIGILSGCFAEFGFFIAASRTISFLPFFLLGYFCTKEQISGIKIKTIPSLLILVITLLIIYLTPSVFHDFKPGFFYCDNSYSVFKISIYSGIIFRSGFYLLAFYISLAVISLTSQKENRFTIIGRRSLYIYIFHTYAVFIFKNYTSCFENWFVMLTVWLLPVLLTLILSSIYFKKLYEIIVNPLVKLVIKK